MGETLFDGEAQDVNGNVLNLRILGQCGIQDWGHISLNNG